MEASLPSLVRAIKRNLENFITCRAEAIGDGSAVADVIEAVLELLASDWSAVVPMSLVGTSDLESLVAVKCK